LLGVVAVATHHTPRRTSVTLGGHAAAPTTTVAVLDVPEDTTTSSTIATPRAPRARPPAAPVTQRVSTPPVSGAAPGAGQVISLADAGLYALDTPSGHVTRLADVAVFDTVGDSVYFASGMTVYSVSPEGGSSTIVYRLPELIGNPGLAPGYGADTSKERITTFEASPDGHAVVTLTAPMTGPNGSDGSTVGRIFLLDPAGTPLAELQTSEVEWSRDGALLAVCDYRGLFALRANGTNAWGPVAMSPPWAGLRWAPDASTIVAINGSDSTIVRYTVASGAFDSVDAFQSNVDVGPDGRMIGDKRLVGGQRVGRTAVYDPRDGSTSDFAYGVSQPNWSPDGSLVFVNGPLLNGRDDGNHLTLRVLHADASPDFTLAGPPTLEFKRPSTYGAGMSWPGPAWAGRFLVFDLAPPTTSPRP
jgi:hypothetical protein